MRFDRELPFLPEDNQGFDDPTSLVFRERIHSRQKKMLQKKQLVSDQAGLKLTEVRAKHAEIDKKVKGVAQITTIFQQKNTVLRNQVATLDAKIATQVMKRNESNELHEVMKSKDQQLKSLADQINELKQLL